MANHTKLSAKQILFCQEYLIDMNATQACIRAGYSKGSANGQGARMLSNASVKAYVKELIDKRADKLDITADKILGEITKVAYIDINEESEVKPSDKLKALDMLGKHVGLYERDNEQSKTKVEVKSGVGELYKVINE